jgi:[ribosomal protein S18]-alanine N-acetyltransferase
LDQGQEIKLPDGTAVSVRNCRESDIPRVEQIEKICFEDPYSLETFLALLESGAVFKVAEVESAVIAYCIYKKDRGVLLSRTRATLISLAVHPANRRRGIGHILLSNAIQDLENSQVHSIELQVRVDNAAAIELYSRLDFVIKKTIPSYYGSGKDAFLMQRSL